MSATALAEGSLCLVDAHAYLHRAYHALPPLTTSSGEPVGALYGFARMLWSLLKREKPELIAVCFDTPGPTFRHKAYPGYKATRKEIDADLKSQLALARPLAEAMGLRCVAVPGFEADDLMATLAARAVERGLKSVLLITGDKDVLQLVGERVKVRPEPKKDVFDAGKVAEKFGVRPDQMVDYLTLVGDSSDNVPGVPGIGAVGAAKLLGRYGTLEALIQAARGGDPDLSAKAARALKDGERQARMSRELIALRRDAPVDAEIDDFRLAPIPKDRLADCFKRFEFHSLAKEILSAPDGSESAPHPDLLSLGEKEKLQPSALLPTEGPAMGFGDWLKAAGKSPGIAVALCDSPQLELFDKERSGDWSLAASLPDGSASWVEARDFQKRKAALAPIFSDEMEWLGHDLKRVSVALEEVSASLPPKRFDTFLAAYCLNPTRTRYDFASVAREYGARRDNAPGAARAEHDLARGVLPREEPGPAVPEKSAALEQARSLWALGGTLRRELSNTGLLALYEELEMPLIDVLAGMEIAGIEVDVPYLRDLQTEFEARIAEVKREIDAMAGREINLNSPKQLAALLFEDLKLPATRKTPKGGISTDEETLKGLMALHPMPAKIMDYRELAKLKSTYIDGLLGRVDAGRRRVHTHFNQAGTATGRLSSQDPNLQNIPIRTPLGQKIRRAFVARKGWTLVSADYSQIDLRVLAHISGDPALTEAFANGEDVHLKTACEIFDVPPEKVDAEMRRRAKAVNFGIVYGQTAHGLSQELGIPRSKAQEYIRRYLARYEGVARWSRETIEAARRDGCARTILGRVRRLPDLAANNSAVRQFNERVAVNTPIQGSSADIIKKAMIRIHREMGRWKSLMLLQVHDELLFECPEAEAASFAAWARREMETAVALKVPLVVDVKAGGNWQDMKPLILKGAAA